MCTFLYCVYVLVAEVGLICYHFCLNIYIQVGIGEGVSPSAATDLIAG